MNTIDSEVRAKMDAFHDALTNIAWGIVGSVIADQRKKLAHGLTELHIKAGKVKIQGPIQESKDPTPWVKRKLDLLEAKTGTWDRGSGPHRVVGPGEAPDTYEMENTLTLNRLYVSTKTLVNRWKHTP